MQRVSISGLCNLFLATEAVGDDQRLCVGVADGRQQHALAASDRDVVMFSAAEAEGTGHAAAAEFGRLDLEPDLFEQLHFGIELHHRSLMAMSVHDGLATELRGLIARHFVRQKFAEQKSTAC